MGGKVPLAYVSSRFNCQIWCFRSRLPTLNRSKLRPDHDAEVGPVSGCVHASFVWTECVIGLMSYLALLPRGAHDWRVGPALRLLFRRC